MIIQYNTPSGLMNVISGKMPVYQRTLRRNHPFEPEVTRLIDERVREGMNVIDCGANFGFHCIHFAKKVGPNGRLYCFEANPEICPILEENLLMNELSNYNIYNVGVWSKDGVLELRVNDDAWGMSSFMKFWPNKSNKTIEIPVSMLDSIFPDEKIDFIKIDVEGGELEVLKGTENILRTCRPMVLMEWTPKLVPSRLNQEIWDFMVGHNYSVSKVCEEGLRPLASLEDVLAVNESRDVFCEPLS